MWDNAAQTWLHPAWNPDSQRWEIPHGESLTPGEEVALLKVVADYGDLNITDLLNSWSKYAEEWALDHPNAVAQARWQAFRQVLQPYEESFGFTYTQGGKIEVSDSWSKLGKFFMAAGFVVDVGGAALGCQAVDAGCAVQVEWAGIKSAASITAAVGATKACLAGTAAVGWAGGWTLLGCPVAGAIAGLGVPSVIDWTVGNIHLPYPYEPDSVVDPCDVLYANQGCA